MGLQHDHWTWHGVPRMSGQWSHNNDTNLSFSYSASPTGGSRPFRIFMEKTQEEPDIR